MKRLAILTGILALAAPLALAQTSTWVSDPNHSEVDFSILHMSVSKVHGRFGNVKATIVYNEADVTKSTVTATIGVDTVDTGVDSATTTSKAPTSSTSPTCPRQHSPAPAWPRTAITLTSTGNLTLHGVTKPVVLDVVGPNGSMTDPKGKVHTGFSATTTIDRTAFGIGPKFPAAMLGDDVSLDIELEVVKQ